MNKKVVSCVNSLTIVGLSCFLASCDAKNKNEQTQDTTKKETSMNQKTQELRREIIKATSKKDAKSPQPGQRVIVHYTGWLDDGGKPGRKFDSSVDREQPFSFIIGVGQVIRGWDEGVMAMKEGEKCRLIIPSHLGYGARGAGAAIPPHATLIFDVELLEIV